MQESISEMLNRNRFYLAKTIVSETVNPKYRKDTLIQAARENEFVNFSSGICMKVTGNRYEVATEFKHPLFIKLLDSFGKVANNS
jgi:hypothetical protein